MNGPWAELCQTCRPAQKVIKLSGEAMLKKDAEQQNSRVGVADPRSRARSAQHCHSIFEMPGKIDPLLTHLFRGNVGYVHTAGLYVVHTTNSTRPQWDFCVNALRPRGDPRSQKNLDATQQRVVNGRSRWWTDLKGYSAAGADRIAKTPQDEGS